MQAEVYMPTALGFNLNTEYMMRPMITTPTLLLNETVCRENIHFMAHKAKRLGLRLRPHFKTHVSTTIGDWFRQEGVQQITVSSLRMARYFADAGWQDITLAFPVNVLEMQTIKELAGKIRLNLLVESAEVVEILNKELDVPVKLWLKVDIGNHRAGIQPDNFQQIDNVLHAIKESVRLEFAGFLGHAGQTYGAGGAEEIRRIHRESLQAMHSLRARYKTQFPDLQISVGDTPSCSQAEDFAGVDEIRPGNFVFYDLMQAQAGSCTTDRIAVAMACPLVAIHADRNELVVYGGAIHFSKDRIQDEEGKQIFGQVVESTATGWGRPIEGVYMKKLSQEHGIIHATDEFIRQCKIGDLIKVLPVHSCLTANLMGEYRTIEGKSIKRMVG